MLKVLNGRRVIDRDDIRRLTKQKIFIPTNISELEYHLNNATNTMAIVLDENSFLVNQLISYLMHVKQNQATYCDL